MSKFAVVVLTAPPAGQSEQSQGPWVKVDGREALLRSVELFLNRDGIEQVQLVVSSDAAEQTKQKFGGNLGFMGVKLTTAGPGWNQQIEGAAAKLPAEATHVLVHDAARPLVAYSDIDAVLDAAATRDVVALTSPLRASLLEIDPGGAACAIHPASGYAQLLTPICFKRARFLDLAKRPLHAAELHLIPGSPLNIRLGSSADERLAKAMLSLLPKPKMKAANNPFEEAQW